MNYVDTSRCPGFFCADCGDACNSECQSENHDGLCEDCGDRRDAAVATERALDFQALSAEWFLNRKLAAQAAEVAADDGARYLRQAAGSWFNRRAS